MSAFRVETQVPEPLLTGAKRASLMATVHVPQVERSGRKRFSRFEARSRLSGEPAGDNSLLPKSTYSFADA